MDRKRHLERERKRERKGEREREREREREKKRERYIKERIKSLSLEREGYATWSSYLHISLVATCNIDLFTGIHRDKLW
jgi:hypothetical protein